MEPGLARVRGPVEPSDADRADAADVRPARPLAGRRPIRSSRSWARTRPAWRSCGRCPPGTPVFVLPSEGGTGLEALRQACPACRIGIAGTAGARAPRDPAVPAVIRVVDGVAHVTEGAAVTGRARWWLAGGVGLALLLAAPWWRAERITRPSLSDGVPCAAPRHRARAGGQRPQHRRHERLRRRLLRAAHRRGVPLCATPPYVCVRIEYWEPRLLIVTEQAQADKAHGQLGQQFGEVTAYPFPVGAVMEAPGLRLPVHAGRPAEPDDALGRRLLFVAARPGALADRRAGDGPRRGHGTGRHRPLGRLRARQPRVACRTSAGSAWASGGRSSRGRAGSSTAASRWGPGAVGLPGGAHHLVAGAAVGTRRRAGVRLPRDDERQDEHRRARP